MARETLQCMNSKNALLVPRFSDEQRSELEDLGGEDVLLVRNLVVLLRLLPVREHDPINNNKECKIGTQHVWSMS